MNIPCKESTWRSSGTLDSCIITRKKMHSWSFDCMDEVLTKGARVFWHSTARRYNTIKIAVDSMVEMCNVEQQLSHTHLHFDFSNSNVVVRVSRHTMTLSASAQHHGSHSKMGIQPKFTG